MEQSIIQVLSVKNMKESDDRDNYKELWAIKYSNSQLKPVDPRKHLGPGHGEHCSAGTRGQTWVAAVTHFPHWDF